MFRQVISSRSMSDIPPRQTLRAGLPSPHPPTCSLHLLVEGRYYMYYGEGLSHSGFGVAVADSPTGPFTYVGRVRLP